MIKLLILFFIFLSVPDRYKTGEISDRGFLEDAFMLLHCPDRYKTQTMCDGVVDDCLATLKFIPDCLVTSKILE